LQRVQALYQQRSATAEQAIAAREQEHEQIVHKLEEALALEKQQSADEIEAHRAQIAQAAADLGKIQQALAFFSPPQ